MESIRIAIVGPTSYTGLELIRLLARHPHANITYLASAREQLPRISDEFPQLTAICDLQCRPVDVNDIADAADVVFTCLPHVAAMQYVPQLLDAGLRVIDLSADYRLADADLYEKTYNHPHTDAKNLAHAVYGLPELFRRRLPDADLVANPGCYPTAAILGIAPLIQRSLVKPDGVIINAASGVSGAGRSPKPNLHFPEVNESFAPYNPGIHRHQPEISAVLSEVRGQPMSVLFVPHLLPVTRGILSTIYLDPIDEDITAEELQSAFEDAYADEPFVRVRTDMPNIRNVRMTNFCDVAVRLAAGKVIVFSAEDNLTKGASGQAVQNMNAMHQLPETTGLLGF